MTGMRRISQEEAVRGWRRGKIGNMSGDGEDSSKGDEDNTQGQRKSTALCNNSDDKMCSVGCSTVLKQMWPATDTPLELSC